jgi:hypothetical protein
MHGVHAMYIMYGRHAFATDANVGCSGGSSLRRACWAALGEPSPRRACRAALGVRPSDAPAGLALGVPQMRLDSRIAMGIPLYSYGLLWGFVPQTRLRLALGESSLQMRLLGLLWGSHPFRRACRACSGGSSPRCAWTRIAMGIPLYSYGLLWGFVP